jgi:hypothetical protein
MGIDYISILEVPWNHAIQKSLVPPYLNNTEALIYYTVTKDLVDVWYYSKHQILAIKLLATVALNRNSLIYLVVIVFLDI